MRPKFERIRPIRIEHSRGEGELRYLSNYNTTRGVPQIYADDGDSDDKVITKTKVIAVSKRKWR